MNIEVKIVKGLPVEQINIFEDRVVYDVAVLTREFTKSSKAYPYLTGELERQEVAAPIVGSNKDYGLTAGVNYATRVYNYKNANWTNPSTEPQWYYNVFNKNGNTILSESVIRALKEV